MIKTQVAPDALTKAQATALTKRIRQHIDNAWSDITKAYEGKAWKALGYGSWEAYVRAEFDISRQRSYQLIDQGKVITAIAEATGQSVQRVGQIPARDVGAVKDDLPAVQAEISSRVAQGNEPAKAATDVIAEKRAAKDKAKTDRAAGQAEHDRQRDAARAALPDAVKEHVKIRDEAIAQAKASDAADGVAADLEEQVRGLEEENAKLKAENSKFADMWVQWQKGGFEAVIAGKDEEIRVLTSRLTQESADKAGWLKRAKAWQKRAIELGWSSDIVIPLDQQPSDEVIPLD
ncbi:hypothetical protein [Mesorhizobium sp. M8A.F.Ca.ET.165.01.1.1]|uniref:hypothetical protein n=1 Tax=Mesorhizobium sp. M8A.F.Ca.ET.165.01.1.1 TaxID=2563960 RepID=UPI0010935FF6|nr:hypothetical protein [Mesorhizobium sp. M8A.F.Ca.ET.165.01.1.1]TGT36198.1 hypothetical protein EN808_29885 [Mesorhizobium sp. M8A.F.Ca.ET.165.01.1.1]